MKASLHRPTKALIDLGTIGDNISVVQTGLPQETAVFAVVKANAYGHGAVAVATYLERQVTGFCVATVDEGLELREAGIVKPILVLGVTPLEAVAVAVEAKLSLTVTSHGWVERLLETAMDLSQLTFHIKLDTGMGRIGFRESGAVLQALSALQERGAIFEGVFTHFARADEVDETAFQLQLAAFEQVLEVLPNRPKWVHTGNSATALWHPEAAFNMVRLGNVIYGLNPSGGDLPLPKGIKPALRLVSQLVEVKQLPAGQSIGYGGTYQTQELEWIGTVPIGYADGLVRSMQGFSVLVDGQLCPIIGRVSMDQITIRLPKRYDLGQQITLLGSDGERSLTAQDWADQQRTIHYEVLCLLSDRVYREYIFSKGVKV